MYTYNKHWNPVLNKFIQIKTEFADLFGKEALWSYNPKEETCLEYWARMLNNPAHATLIEPLQINEHDGMLLIRYANYWSSDDKYDTEKDFFKRYDGFYQECRSIVLDIHDEELVLTPFKKFRNLGECEDYSLDAIKERIKIAKTVEVSDKLDGSMQSARYYRGNYVMAGAQALDVKESWRLQSGYHLLTENYKQMLKDNPDYTFIFEHITEADAHVVKYSKEQEGLYLIGIRNVNTGEELSYKTVLEYASRYGVRTTKTFDKTLDEILSELGDKKSDEAEGFVLNIDGFKVKIKYDDYLLMHHMLDRLASPNAIIRAIAEGTYDDAIGRIPEGHRERVEIIANAVRNAVSQKEKQVLMYFRSAPKDDIHTFMKWVDENVPRLDRGYVRCKYLGKPYNILKTKNGAYKKLSDLNISREDLFSQPIHKDAELKETEEPDYEN